MHDSTQLSTDVAQALRCLSFPDEEYRRRLRAVQKQMFEQGYDALLLHSPAAICYLTGYESIYLPKYYMALIPAEGLPALLVQDFEMHNAAITAWTQDRTTFGLWEDPILATIGFLKHRKLTEARMGLEYSARSLSPAAFCQLRESFPKITWKEASNVLQPVRRIKSKAEIDVIRRACRITAAGMEAAFAAADVGKTDNDVAAAAYQAVISAGSEFMCIDPIVTVGARSGIPHTSHRRTVMQSGDAFFLEIGACVHRYTGVMMRSGIVGSPNTTIQRMSDACRRSLDALVKNIQPSIPACDVAKKARIALGSEGDEFLWHGIYAYSIGLSFPPCWSDDGGVITERNTEPLQAGMVFHANTSLRDIGRFGAAFGETILVTENGCEVLTC